MGVMDKFLNYMKLKKMKVSMMTIIWMMRKK